MTRYVPTAKVIKGYLRSYEVMISENSIISLDIGKINHSRSFGIIDFMRSYEVMISENSIISLDIGKTNHSRSFGIIDLIDLR